MHWHDVECDERLISVTFYLSQMDERITQKEEAAKKTCRDVARRFVIEKRP